MVIRVGKPDNEIDKEKTKNTNNLFKSIWKTLLIILAIFVLLSFLVTNLPGRYKAILISEGAPDEILLLDTVNGNTWRYQCTTDITVITYLGKLQAGDKVPEIKVIKKQ